MVRFHVVVAALGLAALAPAAASQVETPATQSTRPLVVERLRVEVGDSWTYRNIQTDTGKANRTWVETVLAVDEEGITTRRVDRLLPTGRELRPVDSATKFGEGLRNFPLYVGKSWQSVSAGRVDATSYRVVASEVVETAVGRVEALKIECSFTANGEEFHQLIWFAPSVRNIVKLQYAGKPQVTELISYHLSD